jgi:GntR family transcriptional regulator
MASKYDRIADDLRRRIGTGEYPPGSRMPAETTLQAEYRVSLATMRRALDQLEAEGLVEKHHGIGNFVKKPRRRVRRENMVRYQWEKDRARLPESERRTTGGTEYDTGLTVKDLKFQAEYSIVDADADLAKRFDMPEETKLLRRSYRTRADFEQAPLSMSTSYLVYDMVKANPALLDADNEPWPGGTTHQLSTVGIEIDRVVDEVAARPPTAEEAEALAMAPGVAALVLRKTSIDTSGRVVEYAEATYDGERTEMVYSIQLKSWSA